MQNKWRIIFPVCAQRHEKYLDLQLSLVVIGIETAIGDDDMVHEKETHDFACLLYLQGELVVCLAGQRTMTGVIVTKGDDGGIVEYGFLDEQADIHGGFRDAAMREAGSLDKLEVLVHHENPCFLCVEVLHLGEHVVVDGERSAQIGAVAQLIEGTALPQLTGSKDGDGLGRAHSLVAREFLDAHLAE